MMKQFIVALSMFTAGQAYAECVKWEYARLKDADKSELSNLYCRSASHAALAKTIATNRKEAGDFFGAADKMKEQVACMEQLEDAETMLKKKFKAKPTASCASRYKKEVLDPMDAQ